MVQLYQRTSSWCNCTSEPVHGATVPGNQFMVLTVWERYITVSHQLTSGEYSRFPPIEEQLCHLGGVPQALQHTVHIAGVP